MRNICVDRLLDKARLLGIPRRDSKLGIGKRMGSAIWIHRQFSNVLTKHASQEVLGFMETKEWNVLKYSSDKDQWSLLLYSNFDQENEPELSKVYILKKDGSQHSITQAKDPWILHHRWLLVDNEYKGFLVSASIERSIEWKTKFGKNKEISSKIGKKSFWISECSRRGIEP